MRLNKKGEIILTRKNAAELFLLLSSARYKFQGKLRTITDNHWAEFEEVLGLRP